MVGDISKEFLMFEKWCLLSFLYFITGIKPCVNKRQNKQLVMIDEKKLIF